jgi:hypothetical protein
MVKKGWKEEGVWTVFPESYPDDVHSNAVNNGWGLKNINSIMQRQAVTFFWLTSFFTLHLLIGERSFRGWMQPLRLKMPNQGLGKKYICLCRMNFAKGLEF